MIFYLTCEQRQILRNLNAVLEAGGSSLQDAIKVNIFLTDMADFAAVNEVYATFFSDPKPVSILGSKERDLKSTGNIIQPGICHSFSSVISEKSGPFLTIIGPGPFRCVLALPSSPSPRDQTSKSSVLAWLQSLAMDAVLDFERDCRDDDDVENDRANNST